MTQEEIIQEEAIQKIKGRIVYHADETKHRYEIGKGVMDCLASDILIDLGISELIADRDAWKARSEKAEAELKEAVEDINSLRGNPAPCRICEFDDLIGCCHKNHCKENNEFFKWRGSEKKEGEK